MEHSKLYPEAAEIAEREGFKEVAALFRLIARVEMHHEARYLMLLKNITENRVFKRDEKAVWISNCGHVHEGAEAPAKCPTCLHDRSYFEILCDHF